MVNCAVKLCRNHAASKSTKLSGITFFCFPKDPAQKRKWVPTCGRDENWIPTKYSKICSAHFNANDYHLTEAGIKILHKDAIPTENLYHKVDEQKDFPSKITKSTTHASEGSSGLKEARLKYIIEEQKKKIKRLNETVRRKNLKICKLKKVIENLPNKKFANRRRRRISTVFVSVESNE